MFRVARGVGGLDAYENVLEFVAAWNGCIANHDRDFIRIDSAADLECLKESGEFGVIIGIVPCPGACSHAES